MQRRLSIHPLLFAALVGFVFIPVVARAQEAPAPDAAPAAENPAAETPETREGQDNQSLSTKQDAIARRYDRFEKSLLEMAEYMRKTDPDRANLLIRAIGKSKENRVRPQMLQLVELLSKEQFGEAIEQQEDLVANLQALLDLLMSEDRAKELAAEKARIEAYLKNLEKIIAGQKDVRAATERGEPADGLVPRQENLEKRADELRKTIDKDDAERRAKLGDESAPGDAQPGENGDSEDGDAKPGSESGKPGEPGKGKPGESKPGESKPGEESKPGDPESSKPEDARPGESKPGEPKPGDAKPGEGKPGEGKPGEPSESSPGESKPGESQPGETQPGQSQPGQSQPGQSQPGESQPGESQQSQSDSTPGREEIQRAVQEMQKAIDELKKKAHRAASDDQDRAIRELEKAKERLEEILRQLREEERDRFLAALEARFQEMLKKQLLIYNDTVQLDKIPQEERVARHTAKAVQMSRQEAELVLEATKALTLLREEGTAVAFPEAVEQMREDMQLVVGRLERVDVGELTQAIELDIIDALKEMIEALQKEMEKNDQQPPPGEQPPGQPQDPALVETLAELKMLRSLQLRVNGRTQRLGRMIDGEQATDPDLVGQLRRLSVRQARIQRATYDLATGRNQ